jgi:hypothetical protein
MYTPRGRKVLTHSLVTKLDTKLKLIGKFIIFHRRYAVTRKAASEQMRRFQNKLCWYSLCFVTVVCRILDIIHSLFFLKY